MSPAAAAWDYFILTASNARQAEAYDDQLQQRRERGMLPGVRHAFVLPDLEGRRIGSGGSTLYCLAEVLAREQAKHAAAAPEEILRHLRILIVHAGGDSRRLPAYGPCGKIFIPLPGDSTAALPPALFDRLVPGFLNLPSGSPGRGQIVVAAGDALIRFDAARVNLHHPGITALASYATPEEASRHGVYCLDADGAVRLYLQKPPVSEQQEQGAITPAGEAALDIGVMSLDASAAAALLQAFAVPAPAGRSRIVEYGVDLYREICCALGNAATRKHYIRGARASGSTWPEDLLTGIYPVLARIPFHVEMAPGCSFLHFGSTRQLIESGLELIGHTAGALFLNNAIAGTARMSAHHAWVEGCRIDASLDLPGSNALIGVDIDEPLSLPGDACLDVLRGRNRDGAEVWFVRCYGIADTFKGRWREEIFCGRPLRDWLAAAGLDTSDAWPPDSDPEGRSLWNARVFPAEATAAGFRRRLWMYSPEQAAAADKRDYLAADRYSAAEIALLADQAAFHARRREIWARRGAGPVHL